MGKPLFEDWRDGPRKSYWKKAITFMKEQPDQTFELWPKTAQWNAWRQYFERDLGFFPQAMRRIVEFKLSHCFLVPTQWPAWFDSSFVEDVNWRPKIDDDEPHNPVLAERFRQLSVTLQLTTESRLKREREARKHAQWQSPTDDELRAHYAAVKPIDPPTGPA